MILFFRSLDLVDKIFLSFGIGIISVTGLWSILVLLGVPINSFVLIFASSLITLSMLLAAKKKYGKTIKHHPKKLDIMKVCFPLLVFLVSYYIFISFYVNNVVAPHQDAQSHGFVAMFMKMEGAYPLIRPYRDGSSLLIMYPPGYHLYVAILSKLTGVPIQIVIMSISSLCASLSSVMLYLVVYSFFKNRYIIFIR